MTAVVLSTSNIAVRYDVSEDWLKSRIKSGTFKKGVHFYQAEARGAIRWDLQAMDKYWGIGADVPSSDFDHDAFIENLVK